MFDELLPLLRITFEESARLALFKVLVRFGRRGVDRNEKSLHFLPPKLPKKKFSFSWPKGSWPRIIMGFKMATWNRLTDLLIDYFTHTMFCNSRNRVLGSN